MKTSDWILLEAKFLEESFVKSKLELADLEIQLYYINDKKRSIINVLEKLSERKKELIKRIKQNYGEDAYDESTGVININNDNDKNDDSININKD